MLPPRAAYESPMLSPPTLHLALVGTEPAAPTVREALAWARSLGVPAVRLDATRAGVRPRELTPSARRDLAGAIRREGLAFGGLDLLIPGEHFVRAETADRAVAAVRAAVSLARDLADLAGDRAAASVALVLPADAPGTVLAELDAAADAHGVVLADCAHPPRPDGGLGSVRAGVDPAAVLAGGGDPAHVATSLGERLAHARLADLSPEGRCPVGAGRLDLTAYGAAIAVAGLDRITLDVRATRDPDRAARAGVDAWGDALTLPGF